MDKKQIQNSLIIFKKRVTERFQPEKILLFGSFARGEADEYSDVDVMVVSDKFSGIPQEKRLDSIYPLIKDLSHDFHVFSYTKSEFDNLSRLLSISDVKASGVNISSFIHA